MSQPHIVLYTALTPNGQKISLTLEELGIKYDVKSIAMSKNEQKEEWFTKINPNGRIPAIEDKTGGKSVPVFESGAIMLYLVDNYDSDNKISFSHGSAEYWEMVQWLFFLNAGLGPMQGQANHFFRYAPEKIQYGIDRYQNETRRLYGVLEQHLEKSGDWLVGNKYSIADIANFSWVNLAFWCGVEIKEFPSLLKWCQRIEARPLTKKGLDCPDEFTLKDKYLNDPKKAEQHAANNSKWIIENQKKDAEKRKTSNM